MNIKIANTKDITKLKLKSKKLLNNNIGKNIYKQRYNKIFNYDQLCETLDKNQSIWVICTDKNVPIGFGELWQNTSKNSEIGYMIFSEYQKQGYGIKLVEQMFDDCINLFNLKNLKIETQNDNIGSTKIIEKISNIHKPSKSEKNDKNNTTIYSWEF